MSKFYVDPQKINTDADNMNRIQGSVRDIGEAVKSISLHLSMNSASAEVIKRKLNDIHNNILEEAVKMGTLQGALMRTAQLYTQTENAIIDNVGLGGFNDAANRARQNIDNVIEEAKEKGRSFLQKMRDLLVEIKIIPAKKQTRIPGEEVTKHQEKEMDLYMQQEIAKINEKYTRERWNNASVDERKQMLNDYIKEIAAIMGIDITSVDFTYSEPSGTTVNFGTFHPDYKSISINEWVIENGDANGWDSFGLVSTVVHEMRHAYQHEVVNNPDKYVVTDETREAWEKSIAEYKSKRGFMAEGYGENEAYKKYRDQTIEKDARKFAKQKD